MCLCYNGSMEKMTIILAALAVVVIMNICADGPNQRFEAQRRRQASGGVPGMKAFQHKTQHWYFRMFFPVLMVMQVVPLAAGAHLLMQ